MLAPFRINLCNEAGSARPLLRFLQNQIFPKWEARSGTADIISPDKKPARFQKPANDNEFRSGGMLAIVTIPKDSPILQVEIEVFAHLLDDWAGIAANDNEESTK